MLVKTSELIGPALDWAVAKCEGWETGTYMMSPDICRDVHSNVVGIRVPINREYVWFKPSVDWTQGGPIIEREEIWITGPFRDRKNWKANSGKVCDEDWSASEKQGPTPLIAAMRCFVMSKLGDTIEIPEELLKVTT